MEQVRSALRTWAKREAPRHPKLRRLGYFGSYARGDAGVGSDIDLVCILSESLAAPYQRALSWDLLSLPVPAELLVFTEREWADLQNEGGRFARTLERDTVWLFSEKSRG